MFVDCGGAGASTTQAPESGDVGKDPSGFEGILVLLSIWGPQAIATLVEVDFVDVRDRLQHVNMGRGPKETGEGILQGEYSSDFDQG